jgi:Tol biopolymer transport system component
LLLLATSTVAAAGDRRFVVETNPVTLGQAMDWLDRDHVVWHEAVGRDEDGDGQVHIYSSRLDGSEKTCLTCGFDGPNQVPVAQPRGEWILFHSWHGHGVRVGGAGFGGIGSDVWVMRRDGSQKTNLTASPEFHDNFHAYWSPNGKFIVWTALNWDPNDTTSNGKSDVRVARFDPNGPAGPRLVDEHVVRPGNGHWYETQWWAPDGSGFLYTETYDEAVNPELFFCRLRDPARDDCQPVRLTTNPAWDEQAIFTPDMSRIIFMSSRDLPGAHNDWSILAKLLGLPPDFDHVLILLVFSDSFLQPVLQQPTDLWELKLRWNASRTRFKPGTLRRLTTSGEEGWIIPEFTWDPTGKRLLWTQNKYPDDVRVSQSCLAQQVRDDFIRELSEVKGIGDIPFDVHRRIREEAGRFLGDPATYPYAGRNCGGDVPAEPGKFAQETKVAHYE